MSVIGLQAFSDNYIWVIVNEQKHTLACVDPGEADPVIHYLEKNNLELDAILLTHHHHDHIGGVPQLLRSFPQAIVYAPNDARIPIIHKMVKEEDILHIEEHDFRVLNIPGHTSTHVCYQEPIKRWLFCGDTLFSGGCGRVFDGSIEQLHNSLGLLKNLPDDTKVYCGHEYTRQNLKFAITIEPENAVIKEYSECLDHSEKDCTLPSTIALEKKINPFMRTEGLYLTKFAEKEGIHPEDSLSLFKRLRELKNNFS